MPPARLASPQAHARPGLPSSSQPPQPSPSNPVLAPDPPESICCRVCPRSAWRLPSETVGSMAAEREPRDGSEVRASQRAWRVMIIAAPATRSHRLIHGRAKQSRVLYRDVTLWEFFTNQAHIFGMPGDVYNIYRRNAGKQLDVSVIYNNLSDSEYMCSVRNYYVQTRSRKQARSGSQYTPESKLVEPQKS
ncbi:hypothetical protein OBBRIDRAFT_645169 [Obba rivulosa]|uniref:Uncharacterized protein n=1 Tax=Obba rivulosa TaxID=1052685 RepID=A0A8E2DSK5_9APHY|nr:hypothetical protein OBBRIDRAFT_645169 [Obba rivulosa]